MLLLLLACVPPPPGSPPDDDPPAAPSPWSYDRAPSDRGTLTAADLAAAIGAAVALTPEVDPVDFFDAYTPQLTYATEACPTFEPGFLPQVYWSGDCTADSGASFHGWALSNRGRGVRLEDGSTCDDQIFFYGFARIVAPDGTPFEAYGSVSYQDCTAADGTHTLTAAVEGDFHWELAPDWLGDAIPVQLAWSATETPEGRTLALAGSVAGGVAPAATVEFDLAFPEAAGTVRVWDPDGARYDVLFAGGCGAAEAGEVCVDWSALVDWEGRPWP